MTMSSQNISKVGVGLFQRGNKDPERPLGSHVIAELAMCPPPFCPAEMEHVSFCLVSELCMWLFDWV